ncbi:MAG TPA: sugar ABC transporter permease [Actinospica sp.]|nr:sugar ABC transporter permease [Actinospica sp.]
MAETVAPPAGVSQSTVPAARGSRKRRGARDFRDTPMGWLYSAPALLIFAGFVIAPTFYTFYVSLWHWNVLNPALSTYKGLGNYRDLFTDVDPTFAQTLVNSLYFTVGMILLGTAVSLGLALLLMRGGKAMGAARVMVYLPHATPLIATSIIWVWIFNPQFGLANYLLHLLHLPALQWTQAQSTAMPSVILFSVWHEVGFTTLIFLGGLAVISEETGEAARVDGCGPWREFWYVTWPQLRPYTAFIVVITSITSLQAFTQFYQLTSGGGPNNATTTLSFLVYKEGIVLGDTGYGAALAVVLFLITILFTLVRRRTAVGGGGLTS